VRRVRAEVLSTRRLGAYHTITLVAPEIADRARPGQFLSVAVPQDRAFVLRRHFWVHQASRQGGWAGTLEIAVEPGGPGTEWVAGLRAHELLDVIGPLGKGFAYPRRLSTCLLVGEGRGAAPLYFLAQELRARAKRVDIVVGAATQERIFKPIEAKRLSQVNAFTTRDGSVGVRGRPIDLLAQTVDRCGSQVVYAAGPRPMLRAVAAFCSERGLPAQVAVEERMACGLGSCLTCVVPVARKDGTGYDHLRACADGPVFNPARILWDRWSPDEPRMLPTPPEGFPVVQGWPG
jgi:dihydroorotate dehydrogenase electron transfer subunit